MTISTLHPTQNNIHPTAMVHPTATIAPTAIIHPYVIIGQHCTVGEGCILHAHAVLEPYVTLGENCIIHSGAVLGGTPQDRKFQGEVSYLTIGKNTIVRECATIHRATGQGLSTTVGENCFLMAYSHIGHNCTVENDVTLANTVQIAGHVHIESHVTIGGGVVVHQGVNIGQYSMIGGFCPVRQDPPPFSLISAVPARLAGLNAVGLKRNGFSAEQRKTIKQAYHTLFYNTALMSERIEQAEQLYAGNPHVQQLITFVKASQRGTCSPVSVKHQGGIESHVASPLTE
jgi:UDP-N-acetylglucosamine acyltransferase